MHYEVNKGVGAPFYVKGLSKTYAIATAVVIVIAFMFSVITSSAGAPGLIVVGGGLAIAGAGASGLAKLNARFGENGIYKFIGKTRHPEFIIHRRTARQIIIASKTKVTNEGNR